VDGEDWGVFLQSDGTLTAYNLHELLATGSIPTGNQNPPILSFASFH
jgi:hypothetical protein